MKKVLCRFLLSSILVFFTHSSVAAGGAAYSPGGGGHPFALGIIVGEPSGLSARYWVKSNQAADFALAYSFDHFMYIVGDYKFHFDQLFRIPGQRVRPYLGVGAVMAFAAGTSDGSGFAGNDNSSFGMGVRVPFGAEWYLGSSPIAIFLELAPGIGILPGTFGFFDGGIGIRYYF